MARDQVQIVITGDASDAKRAIKSLAGDMSSDIPKAATTAEEAVGRLASRFISAAAAMAAVSKLVSVQREFDILNSSLITMTGSSAAAEQAFTWIQDFAAKTPFSVQEVAGAFVRLKSLGLDPSARALESYGNTASAMGKSLEQFIEAVADAAVGEFERLKEFGIKATQQGDNVALTFRGVSTTIGKNAAEITDYLTKIGENEFAGAMAERAKTLDGAISNLADSWDNLFLTVSRQNAGSLIGDGVRLAAVAVGDLTTIIKSMSKAAEDSAQPLGAMSTIQEGLAITMEAVAVLGVNIAYTFRAVGTEIGGVAAQAAALARLDFSAAKFIGEQMRADAAAARAEVDALTERILNARKAAKAAPKSAPPPPTGSPPAGSPPTPATPATKAKKSEKDPVLDALIARADQERANQKQADDEFAALDKSAKARDVMAQSISGLSQSYDQRNQKAGEVLMSEADRELAEALRQVSERAQQAREALSQKAASMQDDAVVQAEYLKQLAAVDAAEAHQLAIERKNQADRSARQGNWVDGAERALQRYQDTALDVSSATEQAFSSAFTGMEDALITFATTSKLSFSSLATSIVSDILRIQIRATASQAMGNAGGASGIAGWLANLFNGTASGTGAGTAKVGSLWGAQVAHAGGIVGSGEGSGTRAVSAGLYASAPRYHTGGIVGDEVPAILKRGEGVFTREQMKSLSPAAASGGNVSISVNNNGTPQQVTSQRQTLDSRGNRSIVLEIEDLVAAGLSRAGSAAHRSVRGAFGVAPALTRR